MTMLEKIKQYRGQQTVFEALSKTRLVKKSTTSLAIASNTLTGAQRSLTAMRAFRSIADKKLKRNINASSAVSGTADPGEDDEIELEMNDDDQQLESRKRKPDVDSNSLVDQLLHASTSTSSALKPHLSKAARKRLKSNSDEAVAPAATAEPRQPKSQSFRDDAFFLVPSVTIDRNAAFSLSASESRPAKLDDIVFSVNGDENDELSRAANKQVERWDRKTKKFVKIDTKLGRKNESGAKIKDGKDLPPPGSIYERWKKKQNRRGAVSSAHDDGVVDFSDHEPAGNDDNEPAGRPAKRAKMDPSSGKGSQKGSGRGAPGANQKGKGPQKGQRGKAKPDELRNADEIRRMRLQKEKNKLKNQRGGIKAAFGAPKKGGKPSKAGGRGGRSSKPKR